VTNSQRETIELQCSILKMPSHKYCAERNASLTWNFSAMASRANGVSRSAWPACFLALTLNVEAILVAKPASVRFAGERGDGGKRRGDLKRSDAIGKSNLGSLRALFAAGPWRIGTETLVTCCVVNAAFLFQLS
jgi:hypothetical protein